MTYVIAEYFVAVPAGFLIALSMFSKAQKKLRFLNMLGSSLFAIYGGCLLYLSSFSTGWTTLILNLISTTVNIIWLARNSKQKEQDYPNKSSEIGK